MGQALLRATNDGKLWRTVIAHVLKVPSVHISCYHSPLKSEKYSTDEVK